MPPPAIPNDYDGVVAHYPAYNVTLLHLGSLNVGRALYEGGGAAWINPTELKAITDAVYAKCDDLDGAKDGIIGNIKACNAAFDVKSCAAPTAPMPATPVCPIRSSQRWLKSPATTSQASRLRGMDTFPRWALLEGALFQGRSSFGQVPQPSNPLSGKEPLLYTAGDQTAKFIISRNPKLDTLTFDPKQHQERIKIVASIMDVSDVSLEKFKAKGGKIIMTHGTVDDFITPHNTELYYQKQVKQFGQAGVDSFMRFYMIPGFGHGFGLFNAKIDGLKILQNWVEKGQAPTGLTAVDGNPNANRSRPLVRVAEVSEVHRRARQREQRRQLHLRRSRGGFLDPPSSSRRDPGLWSTLHRRPSSLVLRLANPVTMTGHALRWHRRPLDARVAPVDGMSAQPR